MKITKSFKFDDVTGYKFGYLPIGAPKMFSHIYYVDGLLIDTGHSKVKYQVLKAVQDLNIEQIFITHHHEDHSGNIASLENQFNCPVYASELCSSMMKNPPALSLAQKLIWGNRLPHFDLIPKQTTIQTNKFKFDIIPIPGHSPDMVALFEENQQWLFSSDLYVSSYISYFLAGESMVKQIESIKTALKLDFKVLFCAHNPQLSNGRQKLKDKLAFLETFYHDVGTLHLQGLSKKEIFKRLNFKENSFVKFLSGGSLSRMNMLESVIKDLQLKNEN
jgi:glyoxylase-like metal-dependent hydrolase (beta-lactamase superfamily II)